MREGQATMHRRLNITLPEGTVRRLDRVVKRGDRSRLIATAIERYIKDMGRASLRKKLKEGAINRADRDRDVAEAWLTVDEEAWRAGRR